MAGVLSWRKKELLFFSCTVAIIFSVSFFQLRIGQMKTRDAQRKADVELVARALRAYYADYQVYPGENNGLIVSCGSKGAEMCVWGGGPLVDKDNVGYLKKIPIDPLFVRGWSYVYEIRDGGGAFRIYVGLEWDRDLGKRDGLTQRCGENVQCKWYVEN